MAERGVFKPSIQRVKLEEIPGSGRILDVGAGGEGIVSRLAGERVCAVDINIDKIREARIYEQDAHWFLCDGRALCFRENTFDIATLWFSLGYIRTVTAKQEVFREVFRVLRPDGLLLLQAFRLDCEETGAVIRIDFEFPDGTITRTGYGVACQQDQTIRTVTRLVSLCGFSIELCEDRGGLFVIYGRKPETE
jgi:ubiquinone/menaquinone biosynthesis C-methylase UbiE